MISFVIISSFYHPLQGTQINGVHSLGFEMGVQCTIWVACRVLVTMQLSTFLRPVPPFWTLNCAPPNNQCWMAIRNMNKLTPISRVVLKIKEPTLIIVVKFLQKYENNLTTGHKTVNPLLKIAWS
jgi:hypothetical protein